MKTFEEIVREEVVRRVKESPPPALTHREDIDLWANAAFAVLRAGALGVDESEALELGNHFFSGWFDDPNADSLRMSLRRIPRDHLKEAYGLINYYRMINEEGMEESEATQKILTDLAFHYPP